MKMNRIKQVILCLMLTTAITAMGVPAKRGVWRDITLKNGKTVRAELVGDEHFHFFRDSAGYCYVEKQQNVYVKKTQKQMDRLRKKAMKKRSKRSASNKKSHFRRG